MTLDDAPVEAVEDPIDRRVIQLRAYVAAGRQRAGRKRVRAWTSGITVTFDTETATDPSQRLRFGAYQVRDHGELIEAGLFHADDADDEDLTSLRLVHGELPAQEGVALRLISRADFVERAIFKWGLDVGGLIVGFNLPFDLSRISTHHT
jgi:hypothetical protein